MKKLFFLFVLWSNSMFAQQNYDIIHMDATVHIDTTGQVKGSVEYNFQVLTNTDTLFWNIGRGIHLEKYRKGYGHYTFERIKNRLAVTGKFRKGKHYNIRFDFAGAPANGMYFTGWNTGAGIRQVWTQGQGKNNSGWMPGKDDLNDKFTWDIHIGFPAGFEVISNGIRKDTIRQGNEILWHYTQEKPAPYYLLFVGAGTYNETPGMSGKIPVYRYGYGDSLSIAVTYRYSDSIIRWLEQETDVPFPWPVYREIPLRDFFYGGMENVEATTYNDRFLVNDTSLADNRPYNLLAHEAAHQWFGDLITETNSAHHWLHESFATWLAYRIDMRMRGHDYVEWQYFRNAERILAARRKGDTIPLQNVKASTLTFYKKGAWIIRMMQQRVGRKKFRKVLHRFLERHAYGNVTTADFQRSLYKVTGDSLPGFFSYWFRTADIPYYRVEQKGDSVLITAKHSGGQKLLLRLYDARYRHKDIRTDKSFSLKDFSGTVLVLPNPQSNMLAEVDWQPDMDDLIYGLRANVSSTDIVRLLRGVRKYPYKDKQDLFADLVRNTYLWPVYDEVLVQMPPVLDSLDEQIIGQIWKKGIDARKSVLRRLPAIPPGLKSTVEQALDDRSYELRGLALSALWRSFPGNRRELLEKTKFRDNPHDHTLRMLWIVLALNTEAYVSRLASRQLINELIDYASPRYNVETRINALDFISALHIYTPETKEYARLAGKHFHPQLRKQGKDLLEAMKAGKP